MEQDRGTQVDSAKSKKTGSGRVALPVQKVRDRRGAIVSFYRRQFCFNESWVCTVSAWDGVMHVRCLHESYVFQTG